MSDDTEYIGMAEILSAFWRKIKSWITDYSAEKAHTHTKSEITDFPSSLPANGGNADNATTANSTGALTAENFHYKEIDLSGWNESYYFPCIVQMSVRQPFRIKVDVSLDSGTAPSWSTHSAGFSVHFDLEQLGSGWETNEISTRIIRDDYSYSNIGSPVGWAQMTHSSTGVLYLRGGGKYYYWTSNGESLEAKESYSTNLSSYEQSVSYRTDRVVDTANTGKVGYATTAETANKIRIGNSNPSDGDIWIS